MTYLLEHWKPVVGYEGLYEVSNCGAVASAHSHKRLWSRIDRRGYVRIKLWKHNERKECAAHRVVMETFVGICPHEKEVNHKMPWKQNNRVSNLEYVTPLENRLHAARLGLCHKRRKLSDHDVRTIRILGMMMKTKAIATLYGIDRKNIWNVIAGRSYSEVL